MGQLEKLIAGFLVFAVFVYVVLRSIWVPTFHDEAATFFHYIVSEKFLPFQAHWDANNHPLNSALAYICYKILGPQQWWIRLPNVLSFLIYGFYSVRICAQVNNRLIRWMLLVALLTAAFPLEFFSQARGYAMSIAFLMGAIFHGAEYLRARKLKHQLILWLWLWLSVFASLTIVNSYLIILGLTGLMIARFRDSKWKHLTVWLGLGIPCLLWASVYGFELKKRGLLYTGFDDGFIEITVRSLLRYQLNNDSWILAVFISVLGTAAAISIMVRFFSRSLEWNVIRLVASLLLLNAAASITLNLLFGMNFPENRVGMYYIPLFLICVAGFFDQVTSMHPTLRWISLSFLIVPVHLILHANFNSSLLWPKWHASNKLYWQAVNKQRESGRVLTISGDYLNELGWAYYNFQNDAEMQLLQRDWLPDTLAHLIIARPADLDFSSIPYDTVGQDIANNIFLLQRKSSVNWGTPENVPVKRTEFNGTEEFYELINDSISILPDHFGILELTGELTSHQGLFDGHLVIASYASDPSESTYTMIPMHWIRPVWTSDELHIKRTFYFSENAQTFKVYFWNMNRQFITFKLDNFQVSPVE